MAFPTIDACIVCEGVRQEILNKFTLVGFFGIAPYLRILIKDFEIPLLFFFVFCGGAGEGEHSIKMLITDPHGAILPNAAIHEANGVLETNRPNTTVFLGFQGTLTGPGLYLMTLIVDGAIHYSTNIIFDRMPPG